MTANIGSDAAVNELQQTDKLLAEEALATLSHHLWYLSPRNVLFSLASEKLEDDDKSSIAARMLSLQKPEKIKLGYLDFPKLTDKTELRDLVTGQLFDIMKMSPKWLALPPT